MVTQQIVVVAVNLSVTITIGVDAVDILGGNTIAVDIIHGHQGSVIKEIPIFINRARRIAGRIAVCVKGTASVFKNRITVGTKCFKLITFCANLVLG